VAVAYSARSALSAHVLDGIAWILARGRTNKNDLKTRFVINVSMGTQAGPHDGSSILELALDELINVYRSETGERLAIVLAAGNSYEARCHAELELDGKNDTAIAVFVPPDDVTPSYVEFWFPEKLPKDLRLRCVDPTGRVCEASIGNSAMLSSAAGNPSAMIVFPKHTAGGNGTCALVAIEPTVRGKAAHGKWLLTLTSREPVAGIHAYVERDNSMFDPARPRGRQTTFLFAKDSHKNTHTTEEPAVRMSKQWIQRNGTLNSLATSENVIVVGSYIHRERSPSKYSSAGPARNSNKTVPDICAVGDDAIGLSGTVVSGSRTGSTTRMSGTSIAAPVVTSMIADAMSAGQISNSLSVRDWLLRHRVGSREPSPIDNRIGGGFLTRGRPHP
ncbi:MAG: S8 family serine peptidase, partial [Casimicrobium sp.]